MGGNCEVTSKAQMMTQLLLQVVKIQLEKISHICMPFKRP